MKYTKKDNKKHEPKTHKKRSNRKSKKHVKKRGGNTTLKHRGGFLKKLVNRFTDKNKTTIGVGLNELNDIILSPRKETSKMLSTWTNTFVNQGSSLSSKRDDYVGIGSKDNVDNVDKLYKLAKAIYYSVYAHLLETVDMIPFPESLPREGLYNFIADMKDKRDKHFKDFKEEEVNIDKSIKFDDYIKNVSITNIEQIRANNNIFYNKITKKINFIYLLKYEVSTNEDPITITITITDNVKNLIEYLQLVFDTKAGDQTYNKKLNSYKFRVNAENIDKEKYITYLKDDYKRYNRKYAFINVGDSKPTAYPYFYREVPEIEGSYTANTYVPEQQLSSDLYVHAPEIEDNTNVIENRVTPEKEVNIKNVKQGYTKKQVFQPFFTPNNQESNGHDSIVTLLKKHTVTDDIPSPTLSGPSVNSRSKRVGGKRTRSRKKTSHKPKTHKKRSNRKSKKHVKKRGGNTTLKRGGYGWSYMQEFINSKINKGKMSVEEGLTELKGVVMNLNEPADSNDNLNRIESFNTKFKNSGSSLKSKYNIRDFDYDGLEQFKKILFYSVYEELINEFNSDISDKKNRKPINNSAISKKKEHHTEKLINYIKEKRQLYGKPIEFPDKIDIIEGTTIDKCSDRDNICEIKFFDDPGLVIEFNKNIIMPLIDYLYTSNNDNTDDPTPHTP